MKPSRPTVQVQGDREDNVMAKTGYIVGYNHRLVVWRFGFLKNSLAHKAYGVCTPKPLWILADARGVIRGNYEGPASGLPRDFQKVLRTKLLL